ncbi:uncharacterized protein LOC112201787 [Rosa chinensis]|uniref:uncharacterized protein LOC112201787 n=1 Tax=Rosa chinensis TaxID=74649 RepID=UPI000D087077|nr:uncharacterized protein LOC112201787 [Rosa chinensis]
MDKSWMHADRRSRKFQLGLAKFLKFASANASNERKIRCPCLKCCNTDGFSIGVIKDHIFWNGIDESYKNWRWHGEPSMSYMNSRMQGESETVDWEPASGVGENDVDIGGSEDEEISEDSNEFLKYVEDGDKPLYPGCTKTTKLNGLIQTFNLKAKHGMTDACYSDMLIMIGGLLPEANEVLASLYEAKKILSQLGMEYEKIHACPNDCILYRQQHVDAIICPTCGVSRWKLGKDKIEKEGIPAKVLWYFPLIPRLKRLYQSANTSKNLTWHDHGRKKDGMMRHQADSPTWDLIDKRWPEFGNEPRNLRLALSSDGFNPHSSLSSRYSCWPVILITYNLPSWLCMKRKYMMLTLLISGPKQPGNDIDVYLQPLIDDLKLLWNGVEGVYDALRGDYFKLKAVLLWTINYFPAYGNLSGSIVKGYNACPICVDQTRPHRLKNGNKMSFMRHRRFLPRHHPYRKQYAAFDNTIEEDLAPEPLTGDEVLARVESLNCEFGKKSRPPHGKTKDGVAARLDMVEMGIRTDLSPKTGAKRDKLPLATWNLLLNEKKIVCSSFFDMTVPVRFSSNVRSLVSIDDLRLVGLKSHDCHTVMQILLPVALRSVLEKPVRYAIIRFCLFFKAICSKVIDVSKLEKMQADLVVTVCLLEKYFPPSFFDIMIYLTVHLVREVELCGPVFFRWMYPFERYMKVFKGWVRCRRHPEGCIAECYIVEEVVEFCAERMLDDATTAGIPESCKSGVRTATTPLSGASMISVYGKELHQAHLCVLQNTEDAMPFFTEHLELLKLLFPKFSKNRKWLKDKQNQTFAEWLKERVSNELMFANNKVSETMRWLAGGPKNGVPTFSGYQVNGVDFNTKERDNVRSVQNSGVFLQADAMQVSSARDKNLRTDDMDFYGVIRQIWELDYYKFRVPIFKCDWVENVRGIKVDELGFTLVNLNRKGHLKDAFVLSTHVKQIFYIQDPLDAQWSVVIRCPDRDYQGAVEDEELEDIEMEQQPFNATMPSIETFDNIVGDEPSSYMRPGDEGIWIEKENGSHG